MSMFFVIFLIASLCVADMERDMDELGRFIRKVERVVNSGIGLEEPCQRCLRIILVPDLRGAKWWR